METKCCPSGCLQNVGIFHVAELRRGYWQKDADEMRGFLTNATKRSDASGKRDAGRGPAKKPFVVNGVPCCTKAWCTIYGFLWRGVFLSL